MSSGNRKKEKVKDKCMRKKNLLQPYHDIASQIFSIGQSSEELCQKAFLKAAREANLERVEYFLKHTSQDLLIDIDAKESGTGNTALHLAAEQGNSKIAELLLRNGADVTLRNSLGQTAVDLAPESLLPLILDGTVGRGGGHGPRHLLQAAWQGNIKVVKKLLESNRVLDIDCINADGFTPLLLVTRDIDLFERISSSLITYEPGSVVSVLLEHRADCNSQDPEGKTALHRIASCKSQKWAQKITSTLLNSNSFIDCRDNQKMSPLHTAVQYGQTEVINALLDRGADINSRTYNGLTPLHLSANSGNERVLIMLLKRGADVTVVDDSGYMAHDLSKSRKVKTILKEAWSEVKQRSRSKLNPVRPPPSRSGSSLSLQDTPPKKIVLAVEPQKVTTQPHLSGPRKLGVLRSNSSLEQHSGSGMLTPKPPDQLSSSGLATPKLLKTPEKLTPAHQPKTTTAIHYSQKLRSPTKLPVPSIPVTVIGLDIDDNLEQLRLHRLTQGPLGPIVQKQKQRILSDSDLPHVKKPRKRNPRRDRATSHPSVRDIAQTCGEIFKEEIQRQKITVALSAMAEENTPPILKVSTQEGKPLVLDLDQMGIPEVHQRSESVVSSEVSSMSGPSPETSMEASTATTTTVETNTATTTAAPPPPLQVSSPLFTRVCKLPSENKRPTLPVSSKSTPVESKRLLDNLAPVKSKRLLENPTWAESKRLPENAASVERERVPQGSPLSEKNGPNPAMPENTPVIQQMFYSDSGRGGGQKAGGHSKPSAATATPKKKKPTCGGANRKKAEGAAGCKQSKPKKSQKGKAGTKKARLKPVEVNPDIVVPGSRSKGRDRFGDGGADPAAYVTGVGWHIQAEGQEGYSPRYMPETMSTIREFGDSLKSTSTEGGGEEVSTLEKLFRIQKETLLLAEGEKGGPGSGERFSVEGKRSPSGGRGKTDGEKPTTEDFAESSEISVGGGGEKLWHNRDESKTPADTSDELFHKREKLPLFDDEEISDEVQLYSANKLLPTDVASSGYLFQVPLDRREGGDGVLLEPTDSFFYDGESLPPDNGGIDPAEDLFPGPYNKGKSQALPGLGEYLRPRESSPLSKNEETDSEDDDPFQAPFNPRGNPLPSSYREQRITAAGWSRNNGESAKLGKKVSGSLNAKGIYRSLGDDGENSAPADQSSGNSNAHATGAYKTPRETIGESSDFGEEEMLDMDPSDHSSSNTASTYRTLPELMRVFQVPSLGSPGLLAPLRHSPAPLQSSADLSPESLVAQKSSQDLEDLERTLTEEVLLNSSLVSTELGEMKRSSSGLSESSSLLLEKTVSDIHSAMQSNGRSGSVLRSAAGSERSCDSAGTTTTRGSDNAETELRQWRQGNELGRGAYGKVYLGLTRRGEMIAVKRVDLNGKNKEETNRQYEKLQEEVELLKTLKHRNIVGYLGTQMEENVVNIFMEYVPGGSIASVLTRFGALEERTFRNYTREIVLGVEYLHDNNVIHRDIKGANIMLMANGVIKLIDFGCAKRMLVNLSHSQGALLKSMRGTPYWMAPEVINETGHGKKSDIWSIGCTVFEMATGRPPWSDMPPMAAVFAIGSGDKPPPDLPDQFSANAREFVQACLHRDQDERLSAKSLLRHPFVLKKKDRRVLPNS